MGIKFMFDNETSKDYDTQVILIVEDGPFFGTKFRYLQVNYIDGGNNGYFDYSLDVLGTEEEQNELTKNQDFIDVTKEILLDIIKMKFAVKE